MWDLIAEREQERSSNRFSQHAHGREQVRALTAAKRPKLRHEDSGLLSAASQSSLNRSSIVSSHFVFRLLPAARSNSKFDAEASPQELTEPEVPEADGEEEAWEEVAPAWDRAAVRGALH